MLCQECRKRPATLHYTKIINGQKTELHLCQECAEEHKDLMDISKTAVEKRRLHRGGAVLFAWTAIFVATPK